MRLFRPPPTDGKALALADPEMSAAAADPVAVLAACGLRHVLESVSDDVHPNSSNRSAWTEPHSNHCDCGGYFDHITEQPMNDDEEEMIDVLELAYAEKLTGGDATFLAEIGDLEALTPAQHARLEEILDRVRDL